MEQRNLGLSQPQVSFPQVWDQPQPLVYWGFAGKLCFLDFVHDLNGCISPCLLNRPHSHHEGRGRSCSLSIQSTMGVFLLLLSFVVVIGLVFLLFSIQEASIHSSAESHVKDARFDH